MAGLAMVALLWGAGLGWPPVPPDALAAVQLLAITVPVGAAAYLGTLAVLWLACGRPSGAESDLLAAVLRMCVAAMERFPGTRRRLGMS
jgi:hypothetical protein